MKPGLSNAIFAPRIAAIVSAARSPNTGLIERIEKSLTRHTSYCKRSCGKIKSRKKACLACAKAKTQCDLVFPTCSRCSTKANICAYIEGSSPRITVPTLPKITSLDDEVSILFNPPPPDDIIQGHVNVADTENSTSTLTSTDMVKEPDLQPENSCMDIFSLSPGNSDLVFAAGIAEYLADPQISESPLPPQLSGFDRALCIQDSYPHFVEDPFTPQTREIDLKAHKAFQPRKLWDHQFSLNKNFVLSALRSYPARILPGKKPPPFFHPECLVESLDARGEKQKVLPGALRNCAALVQWFQVKDETNAAFFWNTIRMEQERLWAEVRTCSALVWE